LRADVTVRRILCLTCDEQLPSTKYRMQVYCNYFASRDVVWDVRPIVGKSKIEKRALVDSAKEYDAVIVQKKLLSARMLRRLVNRNKRICYDFDDALYAREPFVRKRFGYHPGTFQMRCRLKRVLRTVSCVITGNRTLAKYAEQFNPHVVIVPTPVDLHRFCPAARKTGESFHVGWIGTAGNQAYLRPTLRDIIRFLDDAPDARFMYMSDRDVLQTGHPQITFHSWSESEQVPFLQSLDAGLMPLTDDAWSRGKCTFKALQYMASGAVPVASPVGRNKEVIQSGANGFLAAEQSEWSDLLHLLYQDRGRLHAMATEARATVEGAFSVERCGAQLLRAIEGVFSS